MKSLVVTLVLLVCSAAVPASQPPASVDADKEKIRQIVREVLKEYATKLDPAAAYSDAKPILKDIQRSNREFVKSHPPAYFQPFMAEQHPRATVVTCSDSRVHAHALDAAPDGDLFMVRDIGNQIATAEGSVDYGVHHLHTPLLLIVGHSACGAVKAAASDYSQEPAAIRRELDSLQIPRGEPGLNGVVINVHNQVRTAMTRYEEEVQGGHLTVVGAVYDFRNEMKHGQGRLNIVNVNGETAPAMLAKLDFMQVPSEERDAPPAMHRHRAAAHVAAAPRVTDTAASPVKPAKPAKRRDFIKLPEKPAEMDKPENLNSRKEAARDASPVARPKPRPDSDDEGDKPVKPGGH